MTATERVVVRRGAYADSVTLLQVSRDVSERPGVESAMVAMATPLNRELLDSMGFTVPEASPNDMLVAVRVGADGDLERALAAVEEAIASAGRAPQSQPVGEEPPRTTGSALRASRAGLALVSVPGEHAFVEAMDALESDADVMVFSDNVPVEQEVRLKQEAGRRGRLVMGPDCGTAVIGGVGLGFANAVRPGPVGVVAASGTGCQQLLCLLDDAGVGVSAAIGVGGRDLSDQVGGLATGQALRLLDEDPATEQIVLVSKPPAPTVAARVRELADSLATPVLPALLGEDGADLTSCAEAVIDRVGVTPPAWSRWGVHPHPARPGFLRGLFAGGTLCDEAMLLASRELGPVHSNIPLPGAPTLDRGLTASAHLMVDFGDDALTGGRAHPMIDQTLRVEHLVRQASDPDTAVVLLDVVLGYAAHPDPAPELAEAIGSAIADRTAGPAVVVSLVGTRDDPQDRDRQARVLADAGAMVFTSNAEATRHALGLVAREGAG